MTNERTYNNEDRSTQVCDFIYIVAESRNGPCKVGRSKNPTARIAQLQTANPRRLITVGIWAVDDPETEKLFIDSERSMAEFFGQRERILAGEWFDVPADGWDDEYMNDFFGSQGINAEKIR